MMTDTLQPNDRILKNKDFSQYNIKITNISKKTAAFIAKDKK
jgi:hypothetical protein